MRIKISKERLENFLKLKIKELRETVSFKKEELKILNIKKTLLLEDIIQVLKYSTSKNIFDVKSDYSKLTIFVKPNRIRNIYSSLQKIEESIKNIGLEKYEGLLNRLNSSLKTIRLSEIKVYTLNHSNYQEQELFEVVKSFGEGI